MNGEEDFEKQILKALGDFKKNDIDMERIKFGFRQIVEIVNSSNKRMGTVRKRFGGVIVVLVGAAALFMTSFFLLVAEEGVSGNMLLALSGFMLGGGGILIALESIRCGVEAITLSLDFSKLAILLSAYRVQKKDTREKKGETMGE